MCVPLLSEFADIFGVTSLAGSNLCQRSANTCMPLLLGAWRGETALTIRHVLDLSILKLLPTAK
jgi:hypothetical protein